MNSNETILIVDDSPDNLVVMKQVIAKALPDITILTCQYPEKAIPLLRDTDVALALLDVQMPGIDGIELCKQIKDSKETRLVSVILITSHNSEPKMKARGLESGADDFITRPIDNAELTARVKVELRVHRAETELRQAHQQTKGDLDRSERTLQAIFDHARDGILIVDIVTHGIRTANPAMCHMMGYLLEEMMALPPEGLHPKDELVTVAKAFERQVSGEEPLAANIAMKRKDGSVFYADIHAAPLELGNRTYLLGTWRDVTERKRAQSELNDSYEYLNQIINTIGDPVFVKDEQFRFVLANDAFCEILGMSREKLLETTGMEFLPADQMDHFLAVDRAVLSSGEENLCEESLTARDENIRTIITRKTRYMDAHGTKFIVGVIRDVTERKRAEAERSQLESQLRQSQKLESLGTLAGGVAHEINNPIMGIMNYAQLIQDGMDEESPLREYASEIMVETERVASIVKNLLGFARQEKGSHAPARVIDIVNGTLSLITTVMRHDHITLITDVPADVPTLTCHDQQIRQVLMNLLTNSRDALNEKYPGHHEDKKIIVSARATSQGANNQLPITHNEPEGSYIRLTVEDHGSGIPAEVRERMFDPFFSTKQRDKGTGLGLSISHGIVKDHGGDMSVETEPGQWTRFYVDLPVGGQVESGELEFGTL